jgi:MFS family permease
MENAQRPSDRSLPLYGAVGFSVGAVVGGIIGGVIESSFACAFGYSFGYAVVGAIGSAALGAARKGEQTILSLALTGAIGFGVGHLIGNAIRSVAESLIGATVGHFIQGSIGYDIEDMLTVSIMLFISVGIGGIVLGRKIGDQSKVLLFPLAGVGGVAIVIAILNLIGLNVHNAVVVILTFAITGAALGSVWEGDVNLDSLPLHAVLGFAIGYYAGSIFGLFIGFDFRPDIVAAVAGAVLGVAVARKAKTDITSRL